MSAIDSFCILIANCIDFPYKLLFVLYHFLSNLGESADTLLFDALLLPEVVEDAFSSRQVQKLPDYLKSLAASLHKFYYDIRMIGIQDEAKLLKLLLVVVLSIKTGLSLMGIEGKDRMEREEEV